MPWIDFNAPFAIGETWDFSVRVAAPQTELGAFATSYIPTTGSAVSRTRDIFNFPTAAWFNQTEGTWSAQFNPYPRVPASPRLVAASSTAGSFLNVALSSTTYRVEAFDGTSVGTVTLVAPNVSSIAVGAYDASNKAVCVAGGAVASLARSATYPLTPTTAIYVGSASVNNQAYSGHMEKIKYWPLRLSDTVLRALSQ